MQMITEPLPQPIFATNSPTNVSYTSCRRVYDVDAMTVGNFETLTGPRKSYQRRSQELSEFCFHEFWFPNHPTLPCEFELLQVWLDRST